MKAALSALDLPPVWTAGFAALGWALSRLAPIAPFGGPLAEGAGTMLAGAALALAVWAALTMVVARTPVMPRRDADALVERGPFRFSRNPIYLADLGLLAAFGLWIGSLWPILLTLILKYLLDRRFIRDEEARLEAAFGEAYRAYAARVRRWI